MEIPHMNSATTPHKMTIIQKIELFLRITKSN